MNASRRQAGFTLVEVLLAVFIAGLVMVGSYSVASQVMHLAEDASTRLAVESAQDILRLALGNDLGSVIYVENAGKTAKEAMVFQGSASGMGLSGQGDQTLLSLATAATLDPGQPFPSHGFNRVNYVLRQEENEGREKYTSLIRRERIATTVPDRSGTAPFWNEVVLAPRIEDASIRFYTTGGGAAGATWDSAARERAKADPLPAQVRFTGAMVVAGQRFSLDMRVALPARTLAAGGMAK